MKLRAHASWKCLQLGSAWDIAVTSTAPTLYSIPITMPATDRYVTISDTITRELSVTGLAKNTYLKTAVDTIEQ